MTRSRPAPTRRRWLRALFVTAIVGLYWLLTGPVVWAASESADESVDVGDVVLVDADDPSKGLTGGDGKTAFTVQLPSGATCPGDSLHDQWRVQSFMVPASDDLGALSYGVIGPEGTAQFALFGSDFAAQSYANILMPANAAAGQPGRIEIPPPFSFAVVAGESIPSGNYRIGIACTYFGATAMYWDAEIVVTATPDGTPEQLRWRLAGTPEHVDDAPGDVLGAWVVVGAVVGSIVVAGVVGVLLWHFRSRGRARPTALRPLPRTAPRARTHTTSQSTARPKESR